MVKTVVRVTMALVVAAAGWILVRAARTPERVAEPVPAASVAAPAPAEPSAEVEARVDRSRRPAPRSSGRPSSEGELLRASAPVVIPPDPDQPRAEELRDPAEGAPANVSRRTEGLESPAAAGIDTGQVPHVIPAEPDLPLDLAASEEDAAITANVRRKLDGAVPGRRIQVTTRQGVVTLSGAVDTEQERTQALEAARQTSGVSRVDDRIVVLLS